MDAFAWTAIPYLQVTVWPYLESWDDDWSDELKAVYEPTVVEVSQ